MYLNPEDTRRPAIPAETHGSQSAFVITLLFVAVWPALHAAKGPQILRKYMSNLKILDARRVTRSHKYYASPYKFSHPKFVQPYPTA